MTSETIDGERPEAEFEKELERAKQRWQSVDIRYMPVYPGGQKQYNADCETFAAAYWKSLTAEPATVASEVGRLKRELDAAVHHHAYNMGKIDLALGEPRYEDCCLLEDFLRKIAELKASPPSPPEVIEGTGQVASRPGIYAWDDKDGNVFASTWEDHETLQDGVRYIYVGPFPTFPSRVTFTAPPRPELVLLRLANGEYRWAIKRGDKFDQTTDVITWRKDECEVIDETTGKPLNKE